MASIKIEGAGFLRQALDAVQAKIPAAVDRALREALKMPKPTKPRSRKARQ